MQWEGWETWYCNRPSNSTNKVKSLSRVRLFVTPWTVAYQAPSSMGFSRQEYWSGLPWSPLGDLPNPCIKPSFPTLQADSLMSEPPVKPTCMSNTSFLKTSLQVGPCQPCDPLLVTWLDWSWTPDPIRFTLCRGGNWKMSSSKPDITIQQEWFFWKSITSFLLRTHL